MPFQLRIHPKLRQMPSRPPPHSEEAEAEAEEEEATEDGKPIYAPLAKTVLVMQYQEEVTCLK